MKTYIKLFIAFLIISVLISLSFSMTFHKEKQMAVRDLRKFNDDWYFKLGDNSQYKETLYDTSNWKQLNLPHDWSIGGTYDTIYGSDWQTGYLPAGIGWYRKELTIDKDLKERIIELQFDGVYMNSTVYINGKEVGNQKYGYTSFYYDITPYLKKGKNTIAVKVDNSKPKSARWYTGSGIFRNVWLRELPKAHFKTWAQFVKPYFINDTLVKVAGQAEIMNTSDHKLKGKFVQKVFNTNLEVLKTFEKDIQIASGDSIVVSGEIDLINPDLWALNSPKRHLMVNEFYDADNNLIDSDTTHFGIRKMEFSPIWGFKLNNKITKIKGVCMHHAAGVYGAAVPESVLLYKLQMLKAMGCNAIRTAHNPFSPEFYTMCDSLGILVLDEIFDGWEKEKAEEDYGLYFEDHWQKDVSNWIKNNRNHPSVFMYSIGNEVEDATLKTQKALIDFVKNLDNTRPITQGGYDPTRGMKESFSKTQLDIKGFNGDGEEIGQYEEYHKNYPTVPIIGTEVPHTYQTRGVYRTQTQWRRKDFPAKWEIDEGTAGTMKGLEGKLYPLPNLAKTEVFPEEKTNVYTIGNKVYPIENKHPWKENLYYQSSYDNATVRTSARKAWQTVEALDYVMGQFRWTAFDYLGETNQWPSRFANFGVIDIANLPKDHYYLYQSLWTDTPMVHMLPHWTHPGKEGVKIPIVVYTNTDSVELFLNSKSLGKQNYKGEQLVWDVPYTRGTLSAKAYKNEKQVAEESYTTAKGKDYLRVTSNKKVLSFDKKENALVIIEIVDKAGNLFPLANHYITVDISGPGKLRGLDNGDPLDLTPYSSTSKKAFRGKLVAFVEAKNKGVIVLKIKTKTGISKEIQIKSE